MAARTSTSIGVGITITVLGIATLGLFITSMLFYAQRREALLRADNAEKTSKEILSDADRNDAVFVKYRELAGPSKPNGKPVLRYILDERKELMQRVTGSERDTLESITKLLEKENGTSLAGVIRDKGAEVESLKGQLAAAESARARALQDKENESKRVAEIETRQRQTIAALQADVDKTKAESEALREGIETFKKQMDRRVEDITGNSLARESQLKSEIDKLQVERANNQQRIKQFEEVQRGHRYSGQSEYALVDGQVVATNAGDNTITVNLGRKQRIVLGLPFTVYSQGTAIKADDKTGEYPPGKASVEVIRVEENSSIARVLRQQRGSPIVTGDVIANPIYDPAKKYKFLVFGNFAPAGGEPSVFGANEVKAWIKDWGGDAVDELAGDVDFIVLGEKPQLPPQPKGSAPVEVINFYLNQQKAAQRYDDLLKQATDTAIPVLNENRLRTLLGR